MVSPPGEVWDHRGESNYICCCNFMDFGLIYMHSTDIFLMHLCFADVGPRGRKEDFAYAKA